MTAKHKCVGKIWNTNSRDCSGRVYSCVRNATVKRGGQWYCWQHDPERVKADKIKRRAAEDAKQSRRSGMYARRARDAKLAAMVTEQAAALLGRLAEWAGRARGYAVGHWTADDDQIGTDALAAHALAAQIREALALEVNDE